MTKLETFNVKNTDITNEYLTADQIASMISRHVIYQESKRLRFELYVLPSAADHECYQVSEAQETTFVTALKEAVASLNGKVRLSESIGGMCGVDHRYTIIKKAGK